MRTCRCFSETKEKVTITMAGWDGTGYNGEGKTMRVWKYDTESDAKYVCSYDRSHKSYCFLKVTDRIFGNFGLPEVEFSTYFSATDMKNN